MKFFSAVLFSAISFSSNAFDVKYSNLNKEEENFIQTTIAIAAESFNLKTPNLLFEPYIARAQASKVTMGEKVYYFKINQGSASKLVGYGKFDSNESASFISTKEGTVFIIPVKEETKDTCKINFSWITLKMNVQERLKMDDTDKSSIECDKAKNVKDMTLLSESIIEKIAIAKAK